MFIGCLDMPCKCWKLLILVLGTTTAIGEENMDVDINLHPRLTACRESWTARTMLAFLRLAGLKAEASRCLERQELVDAVDRALQRFDEAHKGAVIWRRVSAA